MHCGICTVRRPFWESVLSFQASGSWGLSPGGQALHLYPQSHLTVPHSFLHKSISPSLFPSFLISKRGCHMCPRPTSKLLCSHSLSSSLCLPGTEITGVGYCAQLHGTGNKSWGFSYARQALCQLGCVFLVLLLAGKTRSLSLCSLGWPRTFFVY